MYNLKQSIIPKSRSVLMKAFPHLYRQSLIHENVLHQEKCLSELKFVKA